MVTDPRYIQYPWGMTVEIQFRWCLCDHIGELIQETGGIQVLVVLLMEIKYQKLVYMQINLLILYYIGTESKLKTKEEL